MLNHYQKTYIEVLADLLDGVSSAHSKDDCAAYLQEKIGDTSRSYLLEEESNETEERRLCEYLVEFLDCGEYSNGILSAIQNAKGHTRRKILTAPYRIASGYDEAADVAIDFIHDASRRSFMFAVDTGGSKNAYAFFKLPYNESIDLIYGNEFYMQDAPVYPKKEMKYMGFYSKKTEKAYCLEEPLSNLYWFNTRSAPIPERTAELGESIKKEIRQSVARCVIDSVPDMAETISKHTLEEKLDGARLAYAKGSVAFDFTERIEIQGWILRDEDYIRYIEDPASLVEEKAAGYLKGSGDRTDELRRLWVAYCASQHLLDQIVACGGLPSEWTSVHTPLPRHTLYNMDGKPVYVIANSEYNCTCSWCIVRVSGDLSLENAPMTGKTYEKNWVAFDHEPPKEVIEAWQAKH